jgi:NADH:ubiquinone oxidoreductase subunit C
LEIQSRVQQNNVETELLPISEETKRITALAKTLPPSEFDQLIKLAEVELKKETNDVKVADILSNEKITAMQMFNKSIKGN